MKTIKYILLSTLCIILFSTCKRKCQDEHADNFEEDRKSTCDYSHADNWDNEILMDSVMINSNKVDLVDENWLYTQAYLNEDNVYGFGSSSDYDVKFDANLYLNDTLNSISYYFSIPVATNYETNVRTELLEYKLYYDIGKESNSYDGDEEVFNFIEQKSIGGVDYFCYEIVLNSFVSEGIIIDKENYSTSYINLTADYEGFEVYYSLFVNTTN